MKTNKKTRIPTLRKCNNRGFVEFNRERIYLGPWGSPETQQAYERAIGEWLSNRCLPSIPQDQLTITELCRDYYLHSTDYYIKPDGSPTSTLDNIKDAMKPLNAIYGVGSKYSAQLNYPRKRGLFIGLLDIGRAF